MSGGKVGELPDRLDNLADLLVRKCLNAGGDDELSAAPGAAELVVETGDFCRPSLCIRLGHA